MVHLLPSNSYMPLLIYAVYMPILYYINAKILIVLIKGF